MKRVHVHVVSQDGRSSVTIAANVRCSEDELVVLLEDALEALADGVRQQPSRDDGAAA